MFAKIAGIALGIVSVLGAMLYKVVYKARNSEHDAGRNKGIRG